MSQSSSAGSNAASFGLLLLRLSLGISLFWKHGLEKVMHFSEMAAHFPDPIHIGSHWSLVYALISDAVCSLLLVLGLGTRVAALIAAVNVGVVFFLVRHHAFATMEGELLVIYFGGFLALLFIGGGRFSLDWKFWRRS